MRRFQLGLAMVALPVFAFTLFLAGCSKEDKKETSSSNSSDNKDTTKPSGDLKPLTASKGHVKGEIRLKGTPSDLEGRTKALVKQMEDKDKEHCLAASASDSEKSEQSYRIGANKLVGNVFVWLKPEKDAYFKISDTQLEEAEKHEVKVHQPHCAFIPHCAVLFPKYMPDPKKKSDLKATGQVLKIKNDAAMSHNTKWEGPPKNPGGNETLPEKKELTVDNLVPSTSAVRFSCTIHPWMNAYLWVFDHPYATISLSDTLDGDNKVKPDNPKFGTFEMKNLPAGKMRIVAWHESGVYLNEGGGNGQPIEIKDGEPTTVNFDLTAK
jgi:hypothetical protein